MEKLGVKIDDNLINSNKEEIKNIETFVVKKNIDKNINNSENDDLLNVF